jgi:ribosome biogenesis protein Tsr3
VGREKQVSDALHRRLPFLPAIEANPAHFEKEEELEAVTASERTLETWIPEKKVKAWNPK